MPSVKTECTELSVALGLLQLEPTQHLSDNEIRRYFGGTLSQEKYRTYFATFARNEKYFRRFYGVGLNLRRRYRQFTGANVRYVEWEGPKSQTTTISTSIDLIALNTPISVKDDSDVIYNRSPSNFFVRLPQGLSDVSRSRNWYVNVALEKYQALYAYAREAWSAEYPSDVVEFHRRTTPESLRKIFRDRIADHKNTPEYQVYQKLYVEFSEEVVRQTVETFNNHYTTSKAGQGANSVNNLLIRNLLRVGDTRYVLCGLEGVKSYAVELPSLSEWTRNWRIRQLDASPDTKVKRQQPVVKLHLRLEERVTRSVIELEYRIEVRWSHGRFCGNPEAKVYKEFSWSDLPFAVTILSDEQYRKLRIVGSGAYGVVYEAIEVGSKHKVALKELVDVQLDINERERFAREVKLQTRMNHRNIMPVLDSDLEATPPWFVMRLADSNLSEIVTHDEGIKQYDRIIFIFRQVLAGIAYAHQQKVIHRDLKPANILLFEQDYAVVSDFGLGKHLDPNSSDWGLTTSSQSYGTLEYIAPEQMSSFAEADFRADIYSLGKILYYCLTGSKLRYKKMLLR